MATYRFFPPVVEESPVWWEPEFVRRLKWPRGISLIKGDGGLFEEIRVFLPDDDWVEGVDYFVGGYHYSNIPQEVADLLIASGYTPEEES